MEGVEAQAVLGKINKFQGRLWEEARSEPLLLVKPGPLSSRGWLSESERL